jgi:hypothetical protein
VREERNKERKKERRKKKAGKNSRERLERNIISWFPLQAGVLSEGFTTNVQPAAIAGAILCAYRKKDQRWNPKKKEKTEKRVKKRDKWERS